MTGNWNDAADLDLNPALLDCPQCGGPGAVLGTLGNLTHCRCQNCGWTFPVAALDTPDEPAETE